MSEMFQPLSNKNAEYKRPIGRFLLEFEQKNKLSSDEMYTYAAKFAADYRDILNPRHRASRVSAEHINNRHVELEIARDADETAAYVWRLYAGDEQYDVRCMPNECTAVYYRLTPQRAVMFRYEFNDSETLATLQEIIKCMTDTYDFHKNASAIRSDSTRTHAAIQELENRKSTTRFSYGDEKSIRALRSHLFTAGFPVGSRDISNQKPLIQ